MRMIIHGMGFVLIQVPSGWPVANGLQVIILTLNGKDDAIQKKLF